MNRQIRVLIHGMTGNLGGMENFIMNYYRNINQERVHFDFLCINNKPAYFQEIIDRGGKIYIISGRRRYITHYQKLDSLFKENKYDVFWSNRCSFPGTALLFKIARKNGVPFRIIHAHSSGNVGFLFNGGLFHVLESYRIEKLATDFWACSTTSANYCYRKKIMRSQKFKIINNAIDIDKFQFDTINRDNTRKKMKIDNKLVVGHVGSFLDVKNHIFLIRVFYEIHKKEPNAVLLLIGDGKLRSKIEDMVKSLNLADAVCFLGIRSDIPALLNAMDMFVFPSKFEGLGIALIEAQVASLHCFASTDVPLEAAITNFVSFIGLKKTPEQWADIILAGKNYSRYDMTEEIKKAGYDIKSESAKVEQYLYDEINHVEQK
jgi:glycosyltransferase involved in cell wall biosynthesis